jgi:SPP1 family predicted phage head-tail adaptor
MALTTGKEMKMSQMDRRITIQQATETRDDHAGVTHTWADVATVWARLDHPQTSNDEAQEAGKQTVHRRTEFTIRYRSDVTEKMRVVYNSENYDILTVQEISRGGFTKLITELRK